MARVCEHLFKPGTDNNLRKPGFYMNDLLKIQIDYYIKNIGRDWDFTIIVCGEGEVRVGKSYLAAQIGAYWTSEIKRLYRITVPFNLKDNMVFDGAKLIEKGNALGAKHPYSVLDFDEAGADLEGTKAMTATTRAVKDYLRECGQYNMLTILVLPEFFDLPKSIALNRSACLINVFYVPDENGLFQRGYFKFFGRPGKKKLYLLGKQTLNYNVAKQDFYGTFPDFFPLDKKEYEQLKKKALKRRESSTVDKKLLQRNIAWGFLHNECGWKLTEIASKTTAQGAYTGQPTITEALKGMILHNNELNRIKQLEDELELKNEEIVSS
ncbi:hypothetical protein LCGC14_2341560 [marine sediment metagenome]|uniref:Zona occludens toxin N-terminal domain-containing protein n=1 Tax=marine sediment metagenome TaxID=412755 RepID=A0A0F9F703_9ZZZZ